MRGFFFACPVRLYACTVFCEVTLIRRNGTPVPRWQLGTLKPYRGSVLVREETPDDLGRTCRMAYLADLPDGPRLYDVQLLQMTGRWLVLSGFERVDVGGRVADMAQTWLCEPVSSA